MTTIRKPSFWEYTKASARAATQEYFAPLQGATRSDSGSVGALPRKGVHAFEKDHVSSRSSAESAAAEWAEVLRSAKVSATEAERRLEDAMQLAGEVRGGRKGNARRVESAEEIDRRLLALTRAYKASIATEMAEDRKARRGHVAEETQKRGTA